MGNSLLLVGVVYMNQREGQTLKVWKLKQFQDPGMTHLKSTQRQKQQLNGLAENHNSETSHCFIEIYFYNMLFTFQCIIKLP